MQGFIFYFIIYRYSECTVISKFAEFNLLQYIDVLIQPKDKIVNYTFQIVIMLIIFLFSLVSTIK